MSETVEHSAQQQPKASTSKQQYQKPVPHPSLAFPRSLIRDGDNVLIRLPSTAIKAIKISLNGNVSLGKYGAFKSKALIGLPYGQTYEITEGELKVVHTTLNDIEETEATNENISSTGAQKITFEDIVALRNEGKSGREIIQRQIEEHSAFDLKTEYSKDKYMKRKEAKFLQMFTTIEPTVHNIALYNYEKQPAKVRDLRPDTLSQLLSYANVRPGGRLLVVEDLHGMVVAGAVERMGGEGRIMIINDSDSPPDVHILESFNFSAEQTSNIASLHWAATEEDWAPPDLPLELDPSTAKSKNSRELTKIRRRKATFDKAKEGRDDFLSGKFDGLIVACEYEPYSILERLLPRLAGSASVVVYSPHLQILHDCLYRLRNDLNFLAPAVIEPWLRQYQVLPGRSHPEMSGMPHGGYLLTCTRVFPDTAIHSVMSGKRAAKRRRLEEESRQRESSKEGEAGEA
ncbi:Gcd10p-domain-containing protein [Meredithblackwellia eburnea MCA 4105]